MTDTGDGKGKTTAALGTALRASGHGLKTAMIQFVKGRRQLGHKPRRLSLMITGREAPQELTEVADTVTSMQNIKHAKR